MDIKYKYMDISKSLWWHRLALGLAGLCLGTASNLHAAPPVLSNVLVTDVTDRSFSLVWTADQLGQPQVEVYTDAPGNLPALNTRFSFYPVNTGNPFMEDRQASQTDIVQAAKAMGIVKVTVSGLLPGTDYYVKYGFETAAQESSLCPDSGGSYCPGVVSLPALQTALVQTRTYGSGAEQVFENDQLLLLDQDVALGELLVIGVENAAYPMTVFAGDGISLPYQLIDFNNLYTQTQSMRIQGMRVSDMGNHGEAVVVRRYQGSAGDITQFHLAGVGTGQGEAVQSVAVSLGDCNGDVSVDGYDILLIEHFLAGTFATQDNTAVAFHPVLCNLYQQEGKHSVATTVNIDGADRDLLQGLLIGTISAENLPEQP